MIFRGERRRIVVSAGLIVALLLASAVVIPLFRPARAFSLVDQTTLIVLKGRVEVASAGATAFTTAATNTGLRVGDRVRTGPDGYGVVTYFDGSTTTLDPDTEVVIRRLDKLPGGGASISYHQEIGSSWNRVEADRAHQPV